MMHQLVIVIVEYANEAVLQPYIDKGFKVIAVTPHGQNVDWVYLLKELTGYESQTDKKV